MVSPARKREAVVHVRHRLGVSERRACRNLKIARSTFRYSARKPEADAQLIKAMRKITRKEPRAGYRTVTRYLQREGWPINVKRVHRLWKQEGLKIPSRTRKKRRFGSASQGSQRLSAQGINHVWSYDFVFDQTENGGRLKWLPVLDEFTRECLALEVARTLKATDVIATLDRLVQARGAPQYIRSDNGPEFVAKAVRGWIEENGFQTAYIEPGAPWQNAYSESFNARFRDEFLNRELFATVFEAKVLGEEHRNKYNHHRPHSSLGILTPAEFAARCPASLRPTASALQDRKVTQN